MVILSEDRKVILFSDKVVQIFMDACCGFVCIVANCMDKDSCTIGSYGRPDAAADAMADLLSAIVRGDTLFCMPKDLDKPDK